MKNDDPYAKSKAIRKGELDNELPSYEEISGWFQRVPITWLPALLSACVHQCAVKGVFQDGQLIEFAKAIEAKAKGPAAGILRNKPETKNNVSALIVALKQARAVLAPMAKQIICPKDNPLSRAVNEIDKALKE